MSPRVSVVTPTYQRAATLPRLYDSLLRQSFRDFEWVVVDDGSSDDTGSLVRRWAVEAPFRIDYVRQANQGKHVAVNRGVERSTGEFCALMDSDDWYAPEALERMVASWETIPVERRGDFAAVEGLCAYRDGELVGDRFPADVFDSNSFEVLTVYGIRGDSIGMYRRDVLGRYPFPEDLGWHVKPALVWNRIAARWSTRFVNEVWAYKEYLPGGLTMRMGRLQLSFPAAQLVYWREFAGMPGRMRLRERVRAHANHVRFALHCRHAPRRQLDESPNRALTVLVWPLGLLLYARDRWRLAKEDDDAG